MLTELTNEQKLNEIYDILKLQEARRKRAIFYRFLKWGIIVGLAYLVYSNQALYFNIAKNLAQPVFSKLIDTVLNDPEMGIMNNMKKYLPTNIELPTAIEVPKVQETPTPVVPVKKAKK